MKLPLPRSLSEQTGGRLAEREEELVRVETGTAPDAADQRGLQLLCLHPTWSKTAEEIEPSVDPQAQKWLRTHTEGDTANSRGLPELMAHSSIFT